MSQVTVYQGEVGLPSGIGPMEADECQIDPIAFAAFVDALLAWHAATRHAVMATLSEGFVATVPALAEKANIEVSWEAADGCTNGTGSPSRRRIPVDVFMVRKSSRRVSVQVETD